MNYCAIFGPIMDVDNTAMGNACSKSGDYVRLIHTVPNQYNYGFMPDGQKIDESGDDQLLIFDVPHTLEAEVDESELFSYQNGMTLEEWASKMFTMENSKKMNDDDK